MIDFHQIFFLLGNIEGDLIKGLIELLLFTFTTYMLTSEYTRDPRRELKYLIAGFGALSFEKLLSTVVLANVVFGDLGFVSYKYYLPVIDNALEVLALILLANAFIFPFFSKGDKIKKNIVYQIMLLAGVFLIAQSSLILEVILWEGSYSSYYWSSIVFICMKLLLIIYPIYTIHSRKDTPYKYRQSIIIAFMIYFIDPFIKIVNLVFFDGNNARLFVASHPFPFIAVALFTRVMYLKVADKAYLKRELAHEKELNEMKDKFVSTISHELRTPLTSINLYTSLLKDKKLGEVNKKQRGAMDTIKQETERLKALINDILDLSKLEKKKELKIEEFDLYGFFENNACYALAKEKRLKIENKLKKRFIIEVDIEKFKQVLINLISNAIKYTDKGKIILNAYKRKGDAVISVRDTGKGIPLPDLKNIFNKFYQVEHYATRDKGGSGLGLTIANEIVKAHNGRIDVKSALGKGSEFRVII
ncbi:hypothetical protein GF336_02915 [Candidatus Woesearchaeota archaeon]|nr:hypothetical protein [Candidatus Woesearchaeota archaeon]